MTRKLTNAVQAIHESLANVGAGVVVTVGVEDVRAYSDAGVSRSTPAYTVTLATFLGGALVVATASGADPAAVVSEVRAQFADRRAAKVAEVAQAIAGASRIVPCGAAPMRGTAKARQR
jgi:hypothetical protein